MDIKYTKKEEELIPLLTASFLSTLVEAGKITGWSNDYVEIKNFIRDLFSLVCREPPNLDPYHDNNDA